MGGVNMPETVINGIQESIKRWGVPRYFVLLSESDYPVKRGNEIQRFLNKANQDFIIANPLPCRNPVGAPGGWWLEDGRRRLECYALRLGNKSIATIEAKRFNKGNIRQLAKVMRDNPKKLPQALRIILCYPKRTHPKDLQPCGGEFWFALRGETARRAIDYCDKHKDFMRYHADTCIPDELVFPTLVHNIVRGDEIAGHTLRHVNWADNGSASPENINLEDIKLLKDVSRKPECMFIRKVQDIVVCKAIDRLVDEDS